MMMIKSMNHNNISTSIINIENFLLYLFIIINIIKMIISDDSYTNMIIMGSVLLIISIIIILLIKYADRIRKYCFPNKYRIDQEPNMEQHIIIIKPPNLQIKVDTLMK